MDASIINESEFGSQMMGNHFRALRGAFQVAAVAGAAGLALSAAGSAQQVARTGASVYADACASCHGFDGRGRPEERLGFALPPPDFTDCNFASREPDPDWFAIIHQGGPARAFARLMPAFGAALSEGEIQSALDHVRTFCGDARWPRGDLNFPLALFTEKAFPEDELLSRTIIDAEGPMEGETELKYERRFGPRGQIEIGVPVAWVDDGGQTETGLGDIAVAWKQTLYASLDTGAILTVGGEVKLPTGDEERGLGGGTAVVEPFVLVGKAFPGDAFFQGQAFVGFPLEDGRDDEVGWRGVIGKTFAQGDGFGRTWTPMLEVDGARDLADDATTSWDVVPQLQVSLSRRQHVLAAVGARIPVTDADERDTQFVFYILWDWFDGGLREGWR